MHASQVPPANPGHCIADAPSLGPQHHPRTKSGSSTSSGEGYCNNPSGRLPLWNPQAFSAEKTPFLEPPPNLELAGSQTTFSGELGPGGFYVSPKFPSCGRSGWRKHKAGSPEPG